MILFYLLILYRFNGASGTRFRTRKISTGVRLVQNAVVSAKAFMSSSAATTETSTRSEGLKAYGSEQIQASNWEFQIQRQNFYVRCFFTWVVVFVKLTFVIGFMQKMNKCTYNFKFMLFVKNYISLRTFWNLLRTFWLSLGLETTS